MSTIAYGLFTSARQVLDDRPDALVTADVRKLQARSFFRNRKGEKRVVLEDWTGASAILRIKTFPAEDYLHAALLQT